MTRVTIKVSIPPRGTALTRTRAEQMTIRFKNVLSQSRLLDAEKDEMRLRTGRTAPEPFPGFLSKG